MPISLPHTMRFWLGVVACEAWQWSGRRELFGWGSAGMLCPKRAGAAPYGTTYIVRGDSSPALQPTLEAIDGRRAVDALAKARGVFLGEHHDSAADHATQAQLIRLLASRRRCCVGLEAVQQQFQPALDAYSRGDISAQEMRRSVRWDERWVWPFERYEPVFEACRSKGVKLLATNVDSEDLARVEVGGYKNLDKAALNRYVPNKSLFVQFANTSAYREYVRYVIEPSYDAHASMGILRTTITGQQLEKDMPFDNFYSGRMLWDSSMANTAADWCRDHPNDLFIGLIGADHVKFGCGVPARFALALDVDVDLVKSVLLNPTPYDTSRNILISRSAASEVPRFVLQIRFAATPSQATANARQTAQPDQIVLPLCDFLWFSDDA